MATAIPSAGSPASDLAPVASIASLGSMLAASMVADSTVAASTVGRLFAAEQGSAVSAPGSDIWAASAGDNWTTETDLPSPNTTRWTTRRKAAVVAAVRTGTITMGEALRRYHLSEEEFLSWLLAFETHGLAGLRATRVQQYRLSRRRRGPGSRR